MAGMGIHRPVLNGLRRPFRATGAELEFYQRVIKRWRTLPADAVLTEAAMLFHFAAIIANEDSMVPENEAFMLDSK
jgi:hypothetical protein